MADFLDQVFDEAPVEPEPIAPEPAPEPVAEAPLPEPEAPEVQEPVNAPEESRNGFVPIAAMMDERDQKKEERARRIALEQEIAQLRQSQQPQSIPDAYDDPEGNAAYMQAELSKALQAQKMDISHYWAVEKHGAESVEAARVWAFEKAQTDPGFRAKLEAEMPMQAMPFEWVVQQHKRDGLYSQLPTDVSSLDELIEREIAKRGLTAPAAVAPVPVAATFQTAPKTAMPPRSIAADASPTSTKDPAAPASFDAIFKR